MNSWENVSPAEPLPFSFCLDRAARAVGGDNTTVLTPQRGLLRIASGHLRSAWAWLQRTRAAQTATRRLRVTETVSLGEKRFLSIVQVDNTQFLIGTSAAHVQLLALLTPQTGNVARSGVQEDA